MSYSPWIGGLVVDGVLGNYGTVKRLLDEAAPPAAPESLAIEVQIAGQGETHAHFEVEVFTNLNRRAQVKLSEPLAASGNPASSYWLSYRLGAAGQVFDNLRFTGTLPVTHCGAYRLTVRYRRVGSTVWWWHNDFTPADGEGKHRDCAIVISPAKSARLSIYEANALTVEALRGGDYQNRSTLDDFLPEADFPAFNPFDLPYVRSTLGFNTLWLMPIFPNTRYQWDRNGWSWTDNYNPGSPFATRDYFSVNPWLSKDVNDAAALSLFQRVVASAADGGLDVMLDIAFNHAGREVRYGRGGVELGVCTPAQESDHIREVRPGWCTRGNEFWDRQLVTPHYREPAPDSYSPALYAPADRLDEHVWPDANTDWYFGDYSSLGPKLGRGFDDPRGSATDERDLFYTDLAQAPDTAELWRYMAHIVPFWLAQTQGKLAGIRADFAQGLPNQAWEYIINVTRNARWDFVFLAEVLDPDTIQYRLNKVMDIFTTVSHGDFRNSGATTSTFIDVFEKEARVFPNSVIMHNGTSHDEEGNPDKWAMVARYAIAAAAYGAPMAYMSQPLGISGKLDFQTSFSNMYEAWTRDDPERQPVSGMYGRINYARAISPELTGQPRYFLNLLSGGLHQRIFALARWVAAGGVDSAVLVFVNLDTASPNAASFGVPRTIRLSGTYNVVNLVADDPSARLWASPRTAEELYRDGVYVHFAFPNEVQYLRLVPG